MFCRRILVRVVIDPEATMKTRLLLLTCSISIGFTLLLGLASCSSIGSKSLPPDYLKEQIQRHPPMDSGLTPYRLNGPYGGATSCLAVHGNTIIVGTSNGKIFWSKADNISWSPSKIESIETVINSIISEGDQLFAATDSGILRSSDAGISWQKLRDGANLRRVMVFQNSLITTGQQGIYRVDRRTGETSPVLYFRDKPEMFGRSSSSSTRDRLRSAVATPDQVLLADSFRVFRSSDSTLKNWSKADNGLGLSAPLNNFDAWTILAYMELHGNDLFALVRKGLQREISSTLFVSKNFGAQWDKVPIPEGIKNGQLFNTSRGIFLAGSDTLHQLVDQTWINLGLPFPDTKVSAIQTTPDLTIIATTIGVYIKRNSGGSWYEANSGLTSWANTHSSVITSRHYFTVANGHLFRSDDQGKSWTTITTIKTDQAPAPTSTSPTVASIAIIGESLFAATDKGLFSGKVSDVNLSLLPLNLDSKSSKAFSIHFLATPNDRELYAGIKILEETNDDDEISVPEDVVFRSNNLGRSWERTSGLPDDISFTESNSKAVSKLEVVRGVLFFADVDSKKPRVFRFNRTQNSWEEVSNGLRQDFITAFGSSDAIVYAAASRPADDEAKVLPQVFKLENPESGTKWTPITSSDLIGRVNALWSDPSHPEVLIAGTANGLFWSNDGGERFSHVVPSNDQPFHSVSAISERNGQLFITTNSGTFYVDDQIPRGKWYEKGRDLLNEHGWSLAGGAFVVLLLVTLSTRLISLLLQLDLWGINQIAPAFYLLPFGRWKLYRGYRRHLLGAVDIKDSVAHYVDIPYETDVSPPDVPTPNPTDGALKLSDLFAKLPVSRRVAVIADGGSGKSTLCAYLVYQCLNKRDIFGGKRLEPVVVDGLSYTGDMLSTVTNALKQDRAYVNKTIVGSQLAAGNLLVIFDGFTEIKETYIPKASTEDLPEFIRQHPDIPFIFTSRNDLPPPVVNALGELITIRLAIIDDLTMETFLSQYLKRGKQEVQSLIKEIGIKFKNLPRIPLLLKLVAAVYDKKGQVPKDTAALFGEYAQQVLRPSATGIDEPIGLNYALRHLVRETYLKSGGDRGLTMDRGVQFLDQIKDTLAAYDIKVAPIKLLQILTRAGLYKQVRQNLKFFHDSFESYFAALVLESDFRDRKYELHKQCSRNERFAETWQFLNEILDDPDDKKILKQLEEAAANELRASAYRQSQRDPSVDYFVSVSSNANNYALEIGNDSQRQTFHLSISPDEFANLANQIRQEMAILAIKIPQKSSADINESLSSLAHLGNYAFREFFSNSGLAAVFTKLSLTEGASLQIASDSCFFPWEFVYSADPEGPLSFENFWGMKHVISRLVVQNSSLTSSLSPITTSNSKPSIGLIADDQIPDIAVKEIPFFEDLAANNKIGLGRLDVAGLSEKQKTISVLRTFLGNSYQVIHIACNMGYDKETPLNSAIALTPSLRLTLSDIEFYSLVLANRPLVVMNTCESGIISPQRAVGFAASFLKHGARGVIATESIVPTGSAATLTPHLYARLLAGKALGASLLEVRQEMWRTENDPIGLFYSLYAPPSLTLAGIRS